MKNKQPIKKSNRPQKERLVAEFVQKLQKSKALVFANYKGMTNVQLEKLKKGLKEVEAELVVTKNSLIQLALEKVSKEKPARIAKQSVAGGKVPKVSKGKPPSDTFDTSEPFDTSLQGPTVTLFAYNDSILPIKELAKSIKTLTLPIIKFAIIDGNVVGAEDVLKLSTLPSHEQLLGQLVGTLKSPIFGLHRALNWNMQKFVITISTIQQKKI